MPRVYHLFMFYSLRLIGKHFRQNITKKKKNKSKTMPHEKTDLFIFSNKVFTVELSDEAIRRIHQSLFSKNPLKF